LFASWKAGGSSDSDTEGTVNILTVVWWFTSQPVRSLCFGSVQVEARAGILTLQICFVFDKPSLRQSRDFWFNSQ
jgi:hypothetical protein